MLKNIFVTMESHPELYKGDPELGLDITGDMVTVDTINKTIYRLPLLDTKAIHHLTDSDPIWDSIKVNKGEVNY